MKKAKIPAYMKIRANYIQNTQDQLKNSFESISNLIGNHPHLKNTYFINEKGGASVNTYTRSYYDFRFYGIDWDQYEENVKSGKRIPFNDKTLKLIKQIDNNIKELFKSLIKNEDNFDIVLINRLLDMVPKYISGC